MKQLIAAYLKVPEDNIISFVPECEGRLYSVDYTEANGSKSHMAFELINLIVFIAEKSGVIEDRFKK